MTAPIASPIWQPATSRVIPISVPANLRTRGLVPEVVTLSWSPKSSADHFDFSLDLSEILSCTGDYVASVSASVPTATGAATDLAVLWTSIVNGLACVFLGGGPPGTTQTVRVIVVTQQGRTVTQDVALSINSFAVAAVAKPPPALEDGTPIPPNAIQLPTGGMLSLGSSIASISLSDLLLPDGSPLLNSSTQTTTYLSDLLLPAGDRLLDTTGQPLGVTATDTATQVFGSLATENRQTKTDLLLFA